MCARNLLLQLQGQILVQEQQGNFNALQTAHKSNNDRSSLLGIFASKMVCYNTKLCHGKGVGIMIELLEVS